MLSIAESREGFAACPDCAELGLVKAEGKSTADVGTRRALGTPRKVVDAWSNDSGLSGLDVWGLLKLGFLEC